MTTQVSTVAEHSSDMDHLQPPPVIAPHPLSELAFCGIGDWIFLVVIVVTSSLAFHVQVAYLLALAHVSFQYDGMTWGDLFLNRWMIPATLPPLWLAIRVSVVARRGQTRRGSVIDLFSATRISSNRSASAVWSDVQWLAARAGLSKSPEVQFAAGAGPLARVESSRGYPRIVIFSEFFKRFSAASSRERAVLAHEMSHVEVNDMRLVNALRHAAWIYVALVGTVGLAGAGLFLLRRYELAWDDSLVALGGRLFFCLVAAIVPFLYVRQFLIQREYLHDRRATQLTYDMDGSLRIELQNLNRAFLSRCRYERMADTVRHFLQFHPLPHQRLRALATPDSLVVDSIAYPFFAGLLLPLASVGLFFVSGDLSSTIGRAPSEIVIAAVNGFVFAALTLAMFAADISRFALLAVRRRFPWLAIVRYLIMLALGSFAGAAPILLIPSSRENADASVDLAYLLFGTAWTVAALTGLFLVLIYVWAVELSCQFTGWRRKIALALRWLLAFPVVLCFQALSISRGFSGWQLLIWVALTLGCIGIAVTGAQAVALGAANRRGRWFSGTSRSMVLKLEPSEFNASLADSKTTRFGRKRSGTCELVALFVASGLFFVPTALAFGWYKYTRDASPLDPMVKTARTTATPDVIDVYRATIVYALSRAADSNDNVKVADMQSAMASALSEAAKFYGLEATDIESLIRQGQKALDDLGESDITALWPLVQEARQYARPSGKPPTFKDCLRAATMRTQDNHGPHAIG